MRVLFTADAHAVPSPLAGYDRTEEWVRCGEFIANYAAENGISQVVVSGDLFDRPRPTPQEIRAVVDWLRQTASKTCPVVIMPGTQSHDGDGPDRLGPTSLTEALSLPNVVVYPRPSVDQGHGLNLAVLPGFSKSWLANTDDVKGLPPVEQHRIMAAKLADIIRGFAVELAGSRGPKLLLGHVSVDGCVASSDQSIRMLSEPVLAQADFPDVFTAVCLGHIHRPQVLQEEGPWIGYSGSWLRMTWGEEGDDRGFWVLDLDDETGVLNGAEFVELPAARLRTVEFDVCEAIGSSAEIQKIAVDGDFSNTIVRVRIRATETQAKTINAAAIRESVLAAGALHYAGLVLETERASRARVDGVTQELEPLKAIELYIDEAATDLAGDKAELLDRARSLLKEVAAA